MPILGGHTVDDDEPKYGLVVVGEVASDRIVSNSGARPGDALVLTKPLGTGIIATAIKAGATSGEIAEAAVHSMSTLNRSAADAMTATGVSAATDITGYGLLGHLRNMLRQSGVGADIYVEEVPELEGARALAAAGHIPGGTRRNLEDVAPDVDFGKAEELDRLLLADAQTSGGLLIAVASKKLDDLLDRLDGKTLTRAVVGRVIDAPAGMTHLH
jgi:selenide,water dikinase